MTYDKNEDSKNEAQVCDQSAELDAVIAEFDELFGGPDTDDGGITAGDQDPGGDEVASGHPGSVVSRTICINFPAEASVCHLSSGIEVSAREILTLLGAARPEMADRLIAIRDGFYSDRDEDYAGLDLSGDTWGPHGPEERAMAKVAHAKVEPERLARRARIEADIKLDAAEAALSEAQEPIKWAPFLEERTRLKNEQEAHFDRADELNRQWEQFVVERETWGEYRAVREDARRAELTEESDALIADQAAYWGRWRELLTRVAEA